MKKTCVVLTLAAAMSAAAAEPLGQDAVGGKEPPTIEELMRKNGGSMTRAYAEMSAAHGQKGSSAGLMFVPAPEPKSVKKHDFITIIIREETEFSSDGKTDLKKSNDLNAHLDDFIKFNKWPLTGGNVGTPAPAIKYGLSRDFNGEGKYDRTDKFSTRIAAEVVDIKPNDTVVLQARKSIRHDEEQQVYILSGMCATKDLTPDNSVFSWQIHDLRVSTDTYGAVHSTQQRGFIPKILDSFNPF